MKHRRHTYATEMVRAGGRPACAHEAARARQSRDDDALRRRCWNRFAAGVPSGPIATPAPGAATESPELLAARRSGRCNRFAAVRSTCHRDVPSLPAERRSEAPPRSTCQSAHQNPRGNTQAQTKRIAGRDWPYKATTRQDGPSDALTDVKFHGSKAREAILASVGTAWTAFLCTNGPIGLFIAWRRLVIHRECDFDDGSHCHRYTVSRRWQVTPLLRSIEGRLHEQRMAADQFQMVNHPILVDESGQLDCPPDVSLFGRLAPAGRPAT